MSVKDLGYSLQKLPLFTQLRELNFQVEQTLQNRSPVMLKNAQWSTDGVVYALNIDIVPIFDYQGRFLGASITLSNVTP